jgi:hypothetical protein
MPPRTFEINETDRDAVRELLDEISILLGAARDPVRVPYTERIHEPEIGLDARRRVDHDDGLATVHVLRGDVAHLLVRLDAAAVCLSWLRRAP